MSAGLLRRGKTAPRGPARLPVLAPIRRPAARLTIGALAYRGVTSAELDEPVRRLADRLGADLVFVSAEVGELLGVEPARPVLVTHTPDTCPRLDVLVVPGGLGWKQVSADPVLSTWLEREAATARGVLAMSTGSLLLAATGRLAGREATGHWLADDELAAMGAHVSGTRVASDEMGRVVTASGAMAALGVVDLLADSTLWAR